MLKDHHTGLGKILEATRLYLIGEGENWCVSVFQENRQLSFIFVADATDHMISERLALFSVCGASLRCACMLASVTITSEEGRAQ